MKDTEALQRARQQLQARIDHWRAADAEELARPDLGRELDFAGLEDAFIEIIHISDLFAKANLDYLPLRLLQAAQGHYGQVDSQYERIKAFSIASTQGREPTAHRDRLANDFRSRAATAVDALAPIVGFALGVASVSTSSRQADLDAEVQKAAKARSAVESLRDEADNLLRAAKESSQKAGIADHATHFLKQAEEHSRWARWWLAATACAAVLTGWLAYVNYERAFAPALAPDGPGALQITVAKVIVFSLLATATLWCAKTYRAHRHNYVVSRHRQNALSSFEAFATSTTDEQSKNAVLLQATQSIFLPQPSGYITGDADAHPASQIIELIRSSTSSPKSSG